MAMTSPLISRAVGLLAGVAADHILRDPQRHHPVAWFGTAATRLEEQLWADDVARGAQHAALCLAPLAAAGILAERLTRNRPVLHASLTAVLTWSALGAASLQREGEIMADQLDRGDLSGARARLSHLCSRDAESLDEPELARAAVESMAENTSDAAVCTLFWGALAGIPGMLVHRGANTLDAMIGRRNERYERFGKASAIVDDVLAWVPARITGALGCALAPLVGGSPRTAARIMWRDHADHPSPNGGWCESAWAGALGVQLGGRNVYWGNRVEDRGLLGDGPRPDAPALRKGASLVGFVTTAAAMLAGFGLLAMARRASR